MDDHVSKPIDMSTLQHVIERVLRPAPAEPTQQARISAGRQRRVSPEGA